VIPTCASTISKLMAANPSTPSFDNIRDYQFAGLCKDEWNRVGALGQDISKPLREVLDASRSGYSKRFFSNYIAICGLGYLNPREENIKALREFFNTVRTYHDGGNATRLRDLAYLSLMRLTSETASRTDLESSYLQDCQGHLPPGDPESLLQQMRKTCAAKAANPESEIGRLEFDSPCRFAPSPLAAPTHAPK